MDIGKRPAPAFGSVHLAFHGIAMYLNELVLLFIVIEWYLL